MNTKANEMMISMNAIDSGMIAALMALDPKTWAEVTTPSINVPVVVYEDDDEIDGVVHQIIFDSNTGEVTYGVDIGGENDYFCDASSIDVVFTELLPDHPYMFSAKNNVCTFDSSAHQQHLYDWAQWLKDGGINILSACGFRVFESAEFGIFFGCNKDDWDRCWELLYEAVYASNESDTELACGFCRRTNSEVSVKEDQVGLLRCERCGNLYCVECLKRAVSDEAIKKMVWEGDTLLCPECARKAGY